MQPREKILAGIVAGLALVFVAFLGYGRVASWFATRTRTLQSLSAQLSDKRLREAKALLAAETLGEFEHRSLPSDRDRARSLYQNWLLGVVDRLKLSQAHVDPGRPTAVGNDFTRLPFTLRARGSLEQITELLFEFYSTNHVHKLRDVALKPIDNSNHVDLTLSIEALVLPGADRNDTLNDERGHRLAESKVDGYVRAISSRNFFAPYVPPKPPRPPEVARPAPPPKPVFDPSKQAVLTALLEVNERPQAWVRLKTSGELLKLSVGDSVDVGQFHGQVRSIGAASIELDVAGRSCNLLLGQSLAQAAINAAKPTTAD